MPTAMKHKLLLFLMLISLCACQSERYVIIDGYAQSSSYHIKCLLSNSLSQQEVAQKVDSIFVAIDKSVSGYNKGSLLSRINNGEDLVLDTIFIDLFNISKEVWEISDGAFDPSAAPLFDLWGFGFKDSTITVSQIIDEAAEMKAYVGMNLFSLESRADGTHLHKVDSRSKLNFNAIAQGYSCDLLAQLLDDYGSSSYIIELGGGEIVTKGERDQGGPWKVGIDKPEDGNNESGTILQEVISISNCGLATSGNYRKYFIEDGVKYSHTINPVTAAPVSHSLLSASVIAASGALADAYATWFMVIGIDAAMEAINTLDDPKIDAYLIVDNNGQMNLIYCSCQKPQQSL